MTAFPARLGRTLFSTLALLGAPVLALATPITSAATPPAVTVDLKIGQAMLDNSGDATELAWLRQFAGNKSLILSGKVDVGAANTADPVTGLAAAWFLTDVTGPGYFALKFGTGGTEATANTFFFQNIGDLTQLVWTNDQVQYLSGGACDANQNKCNIGRLSHYIVAPGDAKLPVPALNVSDGGRNADLPEPAGLALLAVGALAAAGARRR